MLLVVRQANVTASRRYTEAVGLAKRALILSIVGVSRSEVRVPPAAIYGAARAVNSNSLSHCARSPLLLTSRASTGRPHPVTPHKLAS
ncbi:unnamed protein product [Euphydryas editha]|uniref:Uncharacterized protein n=1 Tax=Euphydryas editha TaxID=104508 RepID=A0AAU9V2X4_EUPED|nr:unnamed protein product [Euphydryas editha]